jgi:glutathione S-transferase
LNQEVSMAKVEIIGLARSSYTRVVCEVKGIDYDHVDAPPHSPEVNAIHPFSKVPVMRHGDFTLCESKAIATYLDRGFPGPALMPADAKQAALAEQWISLVNTAMDATLIRTYVFHYIFPKTADGKPDKAAIATMVPTMQRQLGLLDQAVARTGHLVDDQFTLADINVLPILYWVRHFPEGGEAIAACERLSAYYDRHAARPSFKSTIPPPLPPRPSKPS